jgi:7,8-dihydroneopterin aldolase/epimerase/oxygenase
LGRSGGVFMNRIDVIGIKCYAYHGCLVEETKIGQEYVIDVSLWLDFSEAAQNDDLSKTIDYVEVNQIVEQQMAIPNKLIERVGERIVSELKQRFKQLNKCSVTIKKINPPINGNVDYVAICIEE